MPRIPFDEVPELRAHEPLPAGSYSARVIEVVEKMTKSGDEMWRLRFAVDDECYAGRSVWDNLIFSTKALPRVKTACEALGVDVSGELDLTPDMLVDRRCRIEVAVEEYAGKRRNSVTFDGFEAIED